MTKREQGNILSILLLIIILLVLVTGGFFWWQQVRTEQVKQEETEEEAQPAVEEEDPTTGWKTYQDKSYQLSFKYPADWSKPMVDDIDKDIFFTPIDYRFLDFAAGENEMYKAQTVDLSSYQAYRNSDLGSDLERLKDIYQARDCTGAKNLWLPSANAAMLTSTKPEYIETDDGEFRGIYYFASVGQDFSPVIDCFIIMTDGQKKVFQLHMAGRSDRAGQYQGSSEQVANRYSLYIKTLDPETSTEAIVTKFNTVYKYIALSLESIE